MTFQTVCHDISFSHGYCQSENLKGRDHPEDLGVDGRIKLEWIIGQ
jgi:hypothetical protein